MPVKRTVLGPGKLTLSPGTGSKSWESQVTNCTLVPSAKSADPYMVLSGEMVPGDRTESFTLKGKLVPDFGETDSVQEWCFTNRGQQFAFEFVPRTSKSKQIKGSLVVEAVNIGGDVNTADPIDFEFVVVSVSLAAFTPVP